MLRDFFRFIARSKLGMFGMIIFAACVVVALLAPVLAPYEPMQKHYDASGKLMKLRPPTETCSASSSGEGDLPS
jgi:peptide/nickel transport system permease protein